MNRILNLLAAAIAAVIVSSHAALAQPVPVRKEHAYAGTHRPLAQLATVHGVFITSMPLTQTHVCELDGKSLRATFATEVCPSVIYLLPGNYRLGISHLSGGRHGSGVLSGNLAAGRVYAIGVDYPQQGRVSFRLIEKPQGFVLTYKDVMPVPYERGWRQNSRIDP
jgi:hypothetical protein